MTAEGVSSPEMVPMVLQAYSNANLLGQALRVKNGGGRNPLQMASEYGTYDIIVPLFNAYVKHCPEAITELHHSDGKGRGGGGGRWERRQISLPYYFHHISPVVCVCTCVHGACVCGWVARVGVFVWRCRCGCMCLLAAIIVLNNHFL